VVPAFIKVLLKKETPIIHGDGLQTRDFVYVKDVADANIHAMTSEFTGYSYIATGKETSILDLLKTLQALLEVYCATEFKPRREGDMMSVGYHYPDSKFGWEPKVALKEGLINTIEWLKKRV